MAKAEIEKIREILPANKLVDIQHLGSTAIPDLAAKPIIDIQIAALSLDEMKILAVPALLKLGYGYWNENYFFYTIFGNEKAVANASVNIIYLEI